MSEIKSLALCTGSRESVLCEYDMEIHDLSNKVSWQGINVEDTKITYYFPQAIILNEVCADLSPVYHEVRSTMVRMFNHEDKDEMKKELNYISNVLAITLYTEDAKERLCKALLPDKNSVIDADGNTIKESKWNSSFEYTDAELIYKCGDKIIAKEDTKSLAVIFERKDK